MVKLYVVILAIAIVWIFGSLPWLVLNGILCSQTSQVCTNPGLFRQQASVVLLMDVILLLAGIYSARQLRAKRRSR